MRTIVTGGWGALERRSAALFLASGGLLVGHATVRGVRAFTDLPTPMDGFGPAGYLLAFVGLYGLYPALADRSPWLARAGALLAAVPVLDYALILAWGFGEMAGIVPHLFDLVPGAVFFPIHQSVMVLTYGLFGVAVLRTDGHPRRVGVLLLAPPALILALIVGIAVAQNAAVAAFVVGSGMALAHAGIGYALGPGRTPTDHDAPTGDGTAG